MRATVRKPLIYVAAPYTDKTRVGVLLNITRALLVADYINSTGLAWAMTPHQLGRDIEDSLEPKDWYAFTLEVMRRCDAMVALIARPYPATKGVLDEMMEAARKSILILIVRPSAVTLSRVPGAMLGATTTARVQKLLTQLSKDPHS